MTPDLHATWLTVGNNLQPIGDWPTDHWTGLTVLAACLTFAAWALRRFIRSGLDDYRTTNDRTAANHITSTQSRPEPPQPGTDPELLLDCIATYGDCEELDRLRNAINQHRKDNPQ